MMIPDDERRRVCVRAAQVQLEGHYQEMKRVMVLLDALRARQTAGDPVATLGLYCTLGGIGQVLRERAQALSVHEVYAKKVGDVEGAPPG